MKNSEDLLRRMENILDELIANEEHIRDISLVDPSHDEVASLQHDQELLLHNLQDADKAFAEYSKANPEASPITAKQRISEKLHRFQQLNDSFIERLKAGPHFIQFEVHRSGKAKASH